MAEIAHLTEQIKIEHFTTKKKAKFRSDAWQFFFEIFDDKKKLVDNFVICSLCSKIFCYNSKEGTTRLCRHKKEHDDQKNDTKNTLDSYVESKSKKNFNASDRNNVKKAATEFVVRDARPFNALNGDGLVSLLIMFSMLGEKYGKLSVDDVKDVLPSVNTVTSYNSNFKNKIKCKNKTNNKFHNKLKLQVLCFLEKIF